MLNGGVDAQLPGAHRDGARYRTGLHEGSASVPVARIDFNRPRSVPIHRVGALHWRSEMTESERAAVAKAVEAAIDRAADRLIRRLEARYGKAAPR